MREPEIEIQPNWKTIRTIQDKYEQKKFLADHGIPTPVSFPIESGEIAALDATSKKGGFPFMLKSRTEAYHGRGNCPVRSASELRAAWNALKCRPLYVE